MKIKYLGTGAPRAFQVFSANAMSAKEREKQAAKTENPRAGFVDNKLLLDFGPDTNMHAVTGGFDAHNINTCLITHGLTIYLEEMHIRKRALPTPRDKNAPQPFICTPAPRQAT